MNVAGGMGNLEICKYLVDNGGNIEAADNEGKTVLMNAVYNMKNEVIPYLIEQGANVNAKEPNGYTALMFATILNTQESVKLLIKAGANVNELTNEGETVLQRAKKIQDAKLGDMSDVIKLLEKAGAK